MKASSRIVRLVLAGTAIFASAAGHASLIPGGVITDTGSGFGNVNTILTLDDQKGDVAAGAVARSGGVDVTSGDVKPGAVHNATYSFGGLGITNTNQIRIIFNGSEPGNAAANGINLDKMVLSIYTNTGGAALYSASLIAPQVFATTDNGVGKSGYVFLLDALQAGASQAFYAPGNRIGLSASISLASGAPDTFYVLNMGDQQGGGNNIPEPATLMLLGLGLAAVLFARRPYDNRR